MNKLVQVLTQEDTVLFIGSGISLWSGLPSWADLIEELAKFVETGGASADLIRAEAARGDLLQAASYGLDQLTKQQIGEFIRVACRYGIAKPHEIHRKIVSLGVRCYITTNYDNLLEESLRQWQTRFYRTTSNRQLTEIAEIIHARAIDFVFKPHGDASDSDSIILTREQYRQLLPQGERQNALESLKTLLATRPVIYLGFGLRDPDFIYVRELLANTYKGGARDHYAVMADISDAERDYWRRNYGIHLVTYATTAGAGGAKDHSGLLTLLDSLLDAIRDLPVLGTPSTTDLEFTSDVVLSLARHAAGLTRAPVMNPEFPIRVHSESSYRNGVAFFDRDEFNHLPVEKFLDIGPKRSILVGLPGAGKTYSLRRAAARLAERLSEACLTEPFNETTVVVPVIVDLKLYRGSLSELVSQTLPANLPFGGVVRCFNTKIFLDSFNEMPREYWEGAAYEPDFIEFIASIGHASLIVSSRTSDGLEKLGIPTYCLDEIDEEIVDAEIQRMGLEIGGRFHREFHTLLQKPFYFQYIASGAVILPRDAQPRDFYRLFFLTLHESFAERFGEPFELDEALSSIAYDVINRGEEAYPLVDLLQGLGVSASAVGLSVIEPLDIANWLISASVLIPHPGGRVSFVHQSITEYLAAKKLANDYLVAPEILREKVVLKRWDQVLFLAMSLLPQPQAAKFFDEVANADFALALNAAKYVEEGRDQVVAGLLDKIPNLGASTQWEISWIVESRLPISDSHEPQLRVLMKQGGMIGAAAVKRLVELRGLQVKRELMDAMVESRFDYNYCCNGIGRSLRPLAHPEDALGIAMLSDSISIDHARPRDQIQGFISGAAVFLADIDVGIIKRSFLTSDEFCTFSEVRAEIVCRILQDHHSTAALDVAAELLLGGFDHAATAIYFIAEFGDPVDSLSWTVFGVDHIEALIRIAADSKSDSWAVKALRFICSNRCDLAEVVNLRAEEYKGLMKAALLHCVAPTDSSPFLEAFRSLIDMNPEERSHEPTHFLDQVNIDWRGSEELFIDVLRLRDSKLAVNLIEKIVHFRRGDAPIGQVDIGPIQWWLEWLGDVSKSGDEFMFVNRLSILFAQILSQERQQDFVAEFNNPNSMCRRVLATSVLLEQRNLSTDDFSADAVSFLLSDLQYDSWTFHWGGLLLGRTATEQFAEDHLIPLLGDTNPMLGRNLRMVLSDAGRRHGRRYLRL